MERVKSVILEALPYLKFQMLENQRSLPPSYTEHIRLHIKNTNKLLKYIKK